MKYGIYSASDRMKLAHLDAFTRETGLVGRELTQLPIESDARYGAFGVWLEPEDATAERMPVSIDIIVRAIQGNLRGAYEDCVLDRYGVVGMRADDPCVLLDRLQLESFSRSDSRFLHYHSGRDVLLSSARVHTGPAPTGFISNEQFLRLALRSYEEHGDHRSVDVLRNNLHAGIAEIVDFCNTGTCNALLYQTDKTLFGSRFGPRPMQSAQRDDSVLANVFRELPDVGYSHTWGPDELVVCDNRYVQHGPLEASASDDRLYSLDISEWDVEKVHRTFWM